MRPILIIQMQRMGDLILTFPLLLWLRRQYPGHPLWVMAEPQFAGPLKAISPQVLYLAADAQNKIKQQSFELVINLSHRPQSQALAGQLCTQELIGGYTRSGVTHIAGQWQEYRAALVHNNRYNRFHWADLNALDIIAKDQIKTTQWSRPRSLSTKPPQVGLFLGASAVDKRPDAFFWAGLIHELEKRSLVPVLLGGPAEVELCTAVQQLAERPVSTACGRLTLDQLALFSQQLAVIITPDTGPMHLAAWLGVQVLNLSMGPVHAWETGPYQPGHVVVRSSRDCVGCWQCKFADPLCHQAFIPKDIAAICKLMLYAPAERLAGLKIPGLEIAQTSRENGLYHLNFLSARPKAGQVLGAYWQGFWNQAFGWDREESCSLVWAEIQAEYETLATSMRRASLNFLKSLTGTGDVRLILEDWQKLPPVLRPLSGYIALHLANHDFSLASRKQALLWAEQHLSCIT